MTRPLAIALLAVPLVLAGCSSSNKSPGVVTTVAGERVTASVAKGQTTIASEGSVLTDDGKFIAYPDGFTIRFKAATDLNDNSLGYQVPESNTLVRVDLELENKSNDAIPIDGNVYMKLQYGPALYDAESQGYAGDVRTGMDPEPHQVAAQSTLGVYETFSVPKSQLNTIRVTPTIHPERYTPYTFTDVGKAIPGYAPAAASSSVPPKAPAATTWSKAEAAQRYLTLVKPVNIALAEWSETTDSTPMAKSKAIASRIAVAQDAFARGLDAGHWPADVKKDVAELTTHILRSRLAWKAVANAKTSQEVIDLSNVSALNDPAAPAAATAVRIKLGLPSN
jgi:hypothetical protein